jgi:Fe-S oxidoreductase
MTRINSLDVLLTTTGYDYLAEKYGNVIENVQKRCISTQLKNNNLSGDPNAGTLEAKRFANKTSQNYGTARAGHAGQAVKATPVTVPVNVDKEIVVEIENKDISLYGVDGLVEREAASAEKAMVRELERAFFAEAGTQGQAFTPTAQTADGIMEELIQAVETVENDFVDGVERDMIAVVCSPATYGALRGYFDKVEDGGAHGESIGLFHGVRVFSSIYLPEGVNAIAMAEGAVAQPVKVNKYGAERIPLSNAVALDLFFSYGSKAVAADLIQVYGSATTTTGA